MLFTAHLLRTLGGKDVTYHFFPGIVELKGSIHMLAIWQTAQPHSMSGSFSLILISCSKIKETIRKNMFADWQRFSKTSGHLSKSLTSAIRLSRKS